MTSPIAPAANSAPSARAGGQVRADSSAALAEVVGPKSAQVFRIWSDRDTVLLGAEGTVIRVPAGAFAQARQPVAPRQVVELQLREFYSLADMLLERLGTTAGPTLLETGGMVQLTATAAGRPCTLTPGSTFELGFPARGSMAGMRLYSGTRTPGHAMNWKLTPLPAKKASRKSSLAPPHYRGGYGAMCEWLAQQVDYQEHTMLRLNGYQSARQVRRQAARPRHIAVVDTVEASFEVSTTGRVADAWVRNEQRADTALARVVLRALRTPGYTIRLTDGTAIPKLARPLLSRSVGWGPAHFRKLSVRSVLRVVVRFTADRRVLVDHLSWDRPATLTLYRADSLRQEQARHRTPLTNAQLQGATVEDLTSAVFQDKAQQQNGKPKYASLFYLAGAGLGWHNCDRPLPPMPGTYVRLSVRSAGPQTDVSLVLNQGRSVVRGGVANGNIHFEHLWAGAPGTLVAIRREQGTLYLAMRAVEARQGTEPALTEFRAVTVDELKAAIAGISR